MFRRSRFSFRPNVGTAGRPAATPQEAPPANQEASETPRNAGESNNTAPVKDKKSDVTPSDAAASGDGNSQNVEGTSSSAGVQRRKRFSVKPKVAPGRPSALSRTPKSPVKAVSESPLHSGSDLDRPATLNQSGTTAAPKGLQSPRRRRPSEESKQPKMQHKPTPIIFDSSEPSAVSPAVASVEQTHPPAHSSKQSENISDRQVKEVPPRPPERPSLPDKEASEISEKAKTLVSSKSMLSLTPSALSLSRLLNDPSDLQRLVKAQKLRELLREERHKEKKRKRAKAHPKVFTLDPAKMTMRDLIHYLPKSNPMISSLEDSTQENEIVLPPSPGREASPEQTQEPEVLPDTVSTREEEEEPEEEQEEALMVPQVKVAEDGSLIIDEESLTVEVQRAKGPNPAENRDPIFERGSTTTYSSFRKLTHVKRWTNEETDMFFLALSMVGTDFSMICQLFPHRARSEIKNKFKREERENAWRIDKAIRERRKLDIEYFSKLLEKILEYQKSKKKLKSLAVKRPPKGKRKTATNKSARKLSDVEEEDEEDDNEVLDLEEDDEGEEEEGEKENEDLCNEGGILVFEAKKKRKRKTRQTAVDAEPNDKKNKLSEKSTEQGEDGIPEDAEEGPPGDHKVSDKSEKTQNVNTAKNPAIKPAKLSRNRAPQPLLPLGRKWSKKLGPSTKAKNTFPCREGESMSDGTSKEQVNEDASPVSQDSRKLADDDISSEEEDTIVKPPRPTRCGRVPKPTKPLTYPAREEVHPSASETTPASTVGSAVSAPKPKRTAKRKNSPQPAQKSKKPKLVTLTASQSDFLDEDDQPWEDEEVEEVELEVCSGKDSSAPAFVPAGLSAAHPEIKEVDETIAELDILAAMPDVLGISQDVLCHDSSCEQPQHETGSAEPCEHQLDLLVDVIDFISSEQTEVSEDQSYNEAAQTLLTIGNLPLISQSAQCQIPIQDYMTGTASVGVIETSHLEKEEKSATPSVSTFGQKVTQTESVATVEQQGSITHSGEMLAIKTSDVPNQESLNKNLPQAKRACFSKVKAKPNLSHISRTAQSKSEPEIPSVKTAEESNTVSPNITESAPALPTSDISSSLVKLTAEPLDSQPDADHVEAGATSSEESFSEIQSRCCSESRFEPSGDWATRGTKSLSQPADENLMSCAETGFKNPANSDSFITEIEKKRQTNLSSAQKSNDKPLPCVSPVEDLPVTQKEESAVASTSQSRRSRMQKVKPRPNLSQASRAVRSKPQTTMQPAEGDSIQNPTNLQPTCTTSTEEQSQSPDPESVLKPSLNLGSTLSPPEERSTNKEKKTDARPNQSTQDNQNSESQFAPREQATREAESTSQFRAESLTSHAETDSAATASQVGQRENADSAPIQKGSVHPPVFATSAEGVPVGHQEGEVASTSQLRRARLQRVKPKPNLPQSLRTARSKPQTSKQLKERESTPTPSLKLPEKTTADTLPQIAYTTSSEERSQTTDNASVLKPSLNLTSTLSPTKEQSANKEKNTDCGLDLDATLSDHSASEYQNSESRFELKRDQDTSDIKLSSDPSKENLKSCVGIAETVFDNSAKSDFAIREVEQESCTDSTPAHKSSEKPPPRVSPAEGVAVSQKGDREVTTISQSRRTRMQRVKPKPNLIQTSRTSRSKPQTIEHSEEKDLSATPNLKLAEKTAEVESQPMRTISSEEQSQSTDPPGVLEPSLNIASTLTSTEELSTNEDKKTNVRLDLVEANAGQSDSENQNLSESRFGLNREQTTSERDVPAVETTQSSCENVTTPDSAVTVSQVGKGDNADSASTQESSVHPAMLVLPVEACNVESKSQLSRSRLHKFKPKPNLPQTSRTTQSKSQSTKDPVILVQVVEKSCSQTSKPESTDYAKEIEAQPVCSGISPEKPSQLSSTHTCTEELSSTEEEKTDGGCGLISSTESQEQNVTPRQRWFPKVKPKPTLASSARTGHTKQNDNKSGPGDSEEIVDTANSKDSHSGHPGSSFGCLAHVNKQQSEQDHPSNDSQVPLVGGTQVSSIQNASTSNTEEIRSYPILQEILPEQVPLDPDEPFFILSLTEIPVSSAGEVLNSAAEHPSCLSATESSIPQPSSVSGESLETAGEGSLSNVPVFTEEKGVMGLNVNPSEFIVHTVEKTVAPHESTTDQPSKLLDNVDSNESEMPATKQRLKSTGRRAKLQVKPTITRRRQTNKILSAEAAESAPTRVTTTPDLAHSSSVQPKAYDAVTEPHRGSFSHDKDIPTDGKDADSSLGTPSSQSSGTTCQRKRKDSVSSLSETNKQIKTTPSHSSPPGKTASEELKVKTPFASKIQSLPEPVASTSHHVASKQSSTLPPKETHSASITLLTQTAVDIKQTPDQSLNSLEPTPSTSQCFAEQSDCGESSFFDEEPTSVSQYFLSDIFTEVEEE